MRLPARAITDHLVWGCDGSVWACYRVTPLAYAYQPETEQHRTHGRIRAALMALPTESMLLGVSRRVDGAEVAERMLDGIDLARQPAWAQAVTATLDDLDRGQLFTRDHWLAARLPDDGAGQTLRGALAAARAQVAATFGIPAAPPTAADLERRLRQANALRERLAASLTLRPATPGELCWLYARAARRGLNEPPLEHTWEPQRRGDARRRPVPGLARLAEATILAEGGDRRDPGRPRVHRRYLRAETPTGVAYQTFLCVADMPARFTFPGGAGEWFAHLDALGFPVDWCARVRSVGNAEAQSKAKRQARQLASQYEQHDGDTAGVPHSLLEASEGLDDERGQLSANPADPELQATIVLSVAADTLADLEACAAQLQALFEPHEYALPRPTGHQTHLFEALLPGSPAAAVARRDYTQYLLPRDLAAGLPFTATEVGDPTGLLLGFGADTGTPAPVLFDPAYGPSVNRSASLGAFGALGSGKSYAIKTIAHAAVCRGGQVVALDRTADGEYVRFADACPGTRQVVRLAAGADVCLDPLRVFSGDARRRYTIGFLSLLTGTAPTGLEGAALAEAVDAALAGEQATLRDVEVALAARAIDDPDAVVVLRKLRVFARNEHAALTFGDGRLLSLDADLVVFHAPGLSLPSAEELRSEHLARQLLPEQVFSQALLYLLAAVGRSVAFADPTRFAAVLVDEAYALTASMQGRGLLLELVRDGRKHNAALWLLSQHLGDLGDDAALGDLLGARLVFRQDRNAAPAALRFLGMQPDDAWAARLEQLEPGQCLLRDVRDRIGRVQIRPALDPALHAACDTNPSTRHRPEAAA